MSKKQKRSIGTTAAAVVEPARSAAPAPRASFSAEFNPDYSYVIKDLKRIGTLAGTFFVVLVVLSFFLR